MPYQTQKEKEQKQQVIEKFKQNPSDTGSSEVQVALLTSRINHLTQHLREHRKDFSTQRGLLKLVGQRRRMLNYLKQSAPNRYLKVIADLELRK